MRKLIVSLVGLGGSGKTSTANYLANKYGFTVFTFSTAIREYASRNSITLKKRSDYADTHAEMLAKYGWDYTLKLGLGLDAELICIDDVRSPRFAQVIHEAGGKSIAFNCPAETRFLHVIDSSDTAKYPDTLDNFLLNEQTDEATSIGEGLEFNTPAVMNSADYTIDAAQSLENTLAQVDAVVRDLLTQTNNRA